MAAKQIVTINKSLLRFYREAMDLDNEVERESFIQEFKEEITKAINNDQATKVIRWVD